MIASRFWRTPGFGWLLGVVAILAYLHFAVFDRRNELRRPDLLPRARPGLAVVVHARALPDVDGPLAHGNRRLAVVAEHVGVAIAEHRRRVRALRQRRAPGVRRTRPCAGGDRGRVRAVLVAAADLAAGRGLVGDGLVLLPVAGDVRPVCDAFVVRAARAQRVRVGADRLRGQLRRLQRADRARAAGRRHSAVDPVVARRPVHARRCRAGRGHRGELA